MIKKGIQFYFRILLAQLFMPPLDLFSFKSYFLETTSSSTCLRALVSCLRNLWWISYIIGIVWWKQSIWQFKENTWLPVTNFVKILWKCVAYLVLNIQEYDLFTSLVMISSNSEKKPWWSYFNSSRDQIQMLVRVSVNVYWDQISLSLFVLESFWHHMRLYNSL